MWLRVRRSVSTWRVVVVGAEVVVAGVGVGEQVPDDGEDGAADRDDGLQLARVV